MKLLKRSYATWIVAQDIMYRCDSSIKGTSDRGCIQLDRKNRSERSERGEVLYWIWVRAYVNPRQKRDEIRCHIWRDIPYHLA